MTRLRAILAAAVIFVAGGVTLGVALNQAGQAYNMDCAEWSQLLNHYRSVASKAAYVAIASGYTPPAAFDDRVLGDCTPSECVVKPAACADAYVYQVQKTGAVAGWRVFRVDAPDYFRASWRKLAVAQPANAKFLGGVKEAYGALRAAGLSAVASKSLMVAAGTACLTDAGYYCANGVLYNSPDGSGGVTPAGVVITCSSADCADDAAAWRPLSVVSGQDPEALAAETYDDGEP